MSIDESAVLEVVEKVTKSVVNINTVRLLQDYFYQVHPIQGVGSGVIIDQKGHIITNYHVIAGAEKIDVTLASGEVFSGKLVGTFASEDVAVLRINGEKLPTAELGGDWHIGAPRLRDCHMPRSRGFQSARPGHRVLLDRDVPGRTP